jgi:hypothetical protein
MSDITTTSDLWVIGWVLARHAGDAFHILFATDVEGDIVPVIDI